MPGTGSLSVEDQFKQYLQQNMGSSALNPWGSAAILGLGAVQTFAGLQGLHNIPNNPDFKLNAGIQNSINDADSRRGIGFSPQQNAAIDNRITKAQETGYQRAVDQAPGLAGAIRAGINYANESSILEKGFQDARLADEHTKYSDSLRRLPQEIDNMNVRKISSEQDRQRQAYGQAVQSGLNNSIYGFTGLSQNFGKGGKPPQGNGIGEQTAAVHGVFNYGHPIGPQQPVNSFQAPDWSKPIAPVSQRGIGMMQPWYMNNPNNIGDIPDYNSFDNSGLNEPSNMRTY